MDAQLAAVGHPQTEDVHVLARAGADGLGEERDPDPHELTALALLRLLPAQVVIAGDLHGQAHRRLVVAGVVNPAGLGRVGELLGLDEVLDPQLDRIHLQLVGEAGDHPLDEVDGLGDPERARVGHPAGGLVRVDRGHLAVGGLDVVAPGEYAEEPRRVLHRGRDPVEGAMVGEHVGTNGEDLAVLGGGDLAAHDVVAGEAGADEVLVAVLHPLHRLAGDDAGDDGAHVSGVDRDLVAEATADVRRDDPDLVLREPGDDRIQGAVGVGRLRRRPQREPAVDAVVVGDGAAGLHRCGVHARVDDVLRDDDLGTGEHRLGRGLVTGLPVKTVVVGLALEVVADHRHGGIKSLADVHDRLEGLVLDLDQLERIAGRVPVLGHDEGHFLALETHLVRGEDRLHVIGQGRHPGQALLRQRRAGDDRLDLGVSLCGTRVDADDAPVRDRGPEDRQVQHPGQLDVVAVAALAPHEARVLLAEHPAVAHRLLVVVLEDPGRTILDGGHDALPAVTVSGVSVAPEGSATSPTSAAAPPPFPAAASARPRSWSAAHWMERTMVA